MDGTGTGTGTRRERAMAVVRRLQDRSERKASARESIEHSLAYFRAIEPLQKAYAEGRASALDALTEAVMALPVYLSAASDAENIDRGDWMCERRDLLAAIESLRESR